MSQLLLCAMVSGLSVAGAATAGAASANTVEPLVLRSLGPGYAVVSQGPLDPSRFAARAPNPLAVAALLGSVATSTGTYGRTWQSRAGRDGITDDVLRFTSASVAAGFEQKLNRTLGSADVVSSGSLPSVVAAHETTYLLGSQQGPPGVGEIVTTRAGADVAVLTFASVADRNPQPIAPSAAARVVMAERARLVSAHPGTDAAPPTKGPSDAAIGWAVTAVAVLAVAVATPLVLRHRRGAAHST